MVERINPLGQQHSRFVGFLCGGRERQDECRAKSKILRSPAYREAKNPTARQRPADLKIEPMEPNAVVRLVHAGRGQCCKSFAFLLDRPQPFLGHHGYGSFPQILPHELTGLPMANMLSQKTEINKSEEEMPVKSALLGDN